MKLLSRKKSRFALLMLWFIVVTGVSGCDRGPKLQQIENLVPDTAAAVFVVHDLEQAIKGFEDTSIGQLLDRPDMKRFAQSHVPPAVSSSPPFGLGLQRAQELFQGTLLLSVPDDSKDPDSRYAPVFIADVSKTRDDLQDFLNKELLPSLQQCYPGIQIVENEYEDITYQHITDPSGISVYYATLDKAFLSTASYNTFTDTIDRYLSKDKLVSIEENPSYQAAVKDIRKKSTGYGYVNLRTLREDQQAQLLQHVPGRQASALQASAETLETLGWSFSYKNGGILDKIALQTAPSANGESGPLFENTGELRTLRMVPDDMLFYAGIRVNNPAGLWHRIRESLKKTMGSDEFQEFFQTLKQESGVDLNELFGNLGGELAVAAGIKHFSIESLLNDLGAQGKFNVDNFPVQFLVQVKDSEKHSRMIEALTGPAREQEPYQGYTISSCLIPDMMVPTRLYHAQADAIWIAALSKTALKRALDVTAEGEGSLQEAEKFKQLRQQVSKKVFSMTYLDIPGLLAILDRSLQGMGGLIFRGILTAQGVELEHLPDLKTIAASLSGSLSVTTAQEHGVTIESYSPVGSVFIKSGLLAGILSEFSPEE